ncbi:MAG: hypothetical protein E7408_07545 [Ruminococcaceae bacterium]|nr:hypothetical protein [Oscillospiraceae bacterium]
MIPTVLGMISREEIGVATTHEHIFIDLTGFFTEHPVRGVVDPKTAKVCIENLGVLNRDPYALRDNLLMMDPKVQKKELLYFKNAGGQTIVDATTIGIHRSPELLRRMSEETGLHVIAGTGYYVGGTHSDFVRSADVDTLAEKMVQELTVGMDGTDIRAGIIGEIGISEIFDDSERKVLRAAARAQKKTGAGLMIHINPWTVNGLEATNIALSEGVAPDRIAICHIDVENREDYIFRLLDMGVYVEFDNFGKEYYVDRDVRNSGYGLFVRDTDRVALLKKMIERGYKKQVLLSCDVCLKTLLHTYGGWGYDHLLTNVLPMMEDAGIRMQDVRSMLVDNAADFLDWR